MRDAGCGVRENRTTMHRLDAYLPVDTNILPRVSKLERLDAWRAAQDLAYEAYLLTLSPALSRHFALIDQIRRAALSVPANIAEGYALGTTPQFLRGLKIALGSNSELYSHLTVLARLELVSSANVKSVLALSDRVIAMTIGLIRKLSERSWLPIKQRSPTTSS
jgi:four helix bundle protein